MFNSTIGNRVLSLVKKKLKKITIALSPYYCICERLLYYKHFITAESLRKQLTGPGDLAQIFVSTDDVSLLRSGLCF